MQVDKIKNFEQLLKPYLKNNVIVKEYTVTPLTKAGDNYGSLMLSLNVTLNNDDTLKLVAKMCPPNDFIKELFKIPLSFKKEVAMYTEIIPTLNEFRQKQGAFEKLQLTPDFYGARINLKNSETVDDDAIILLKNLKAEGFRELDRMVGFNLEAAECVLKKLAIFHAVPIALKMLQPDVFQEKIKPHLKRSGLFDKIEEQSVHELIEFLASALMAEERCIPLLPKVRDMLKNNFYTLTHSKEVQELFATISHNDLWVNNILFQLDDAGKPLDSVLIDFQLYEYGSVGNDIVFILFTSLQKEVLDTHYDHLLETYYNEFITTLANLDCPTKIFSFELFLEEIELAATTSQFFHILIMMRHVLAQHEQMKEINELSIEDFSIRTSQLSEAYWKRLPEIVLEFHKRNWI